ASCAGEKRKNRAIYGTPWENLIQMCYFCNRKQLNRLMRQNNIIKIDIDQVVKERAKNKKVPRFLINYLKKIAHQEEINKFLEENSNLKNLDFIDAGLQFMGIETEVKGRENLPPKDGRYIFASNHPLGGLDGMATGMLIGKEYD